MYKASDLTKSAYRIGETADFLGVSPATLRKYDKEGRIHSYRNEGGHRRYPREEIVRYLCEKGTMTDDSLQKRRDIVYARVSSHEQKSKGDLDRQILFLIRSVPDLQNPMILSEVGSGLNDSRKQIQRLIAMVERDEVRNVYITYKDRLTRFGYHYLETMFQMHNTQIIPVKGNPDGSDKTVQEELVEDMFSLIASFSGKLYGLRSRKSKADIQNNTLQPENREA